MAKSKRAKLQKAFSPSSSSPSVPDDNADDPDLMDELLAHLDSKDASVREESATVIAEVQSREVADASPPPKKDSKSRYLARQAKKAVAFAQNQGNDDPQAEAQRAADIQNEKTGIQSVCDDLNLELYEISPDGHCLFSAVADQLALLDIISSRDAHHSTTRLAAANYMRSHPDEFLPFLTSESGNMMTDSEYDQYCAAIRDTGLWGGEHEILALTRMYNTPIHVIQATNPPIVMHNPSTAPTPDQARTKSAARISYHRYTYGLGEHYNSLRPKSSLKGTLSNLMH